MTMISHCLMNGIANLYIHNWITKYRWSNRSQEVKTTFLRQAITDLIFTVENIAIVVVTANTSHLKEVPTGILIFVLLGHFFGIILKCVYYYSWHMWTAAFDIVKIDNTNRCPIIAFSIPYYLFGRSGTFEFGSTAYDEDIRNAYANRVRRPTMENIFNRQSIRQDITSVASFNIPTFQTSTEKDLISAIQTMSSSKHNRPLAATSTEPTNDYKQDIYELRYLFEEFIKELETPQEDKTNVKVTKKIRFEV